MKKALFILLIVLLASSCVTNQFTQSDFDSGKSVTSPLGDALLGIVPGLSQVFHGEYLEAISYFSATIVQSVLLTELYGVEDISFSSNNDPGQNILQVGFLGSYLWSYSDGIYTGIRRRKQEEIFVQDREIIRRQERELAEQEEFERQRQIREANVAEEEYQQAKRIQDLRDERYFMGSLRIGLQRRALLSEFPGYSSESVSNVRGTMIHSYVYEWNGNFYVVYFDNNELSSWHKQ